MAYTIKRAVFIHLFFSHEGSPKNFLTFTKFYDSNDTYLYYKS